MYEIHDVTQSLITDSLPIHASHRVVGVAHDEVDGYLVSCLAGDGLEGMAKGVEAQTGAM